MIQLSIVQWFMNKRLGACNAMQCNAMQCNAMQCNAMQCNAMQCNANDVSPYLLFCVMLRGLCAPAPKGARGWCTTPA